MPPSREVMPVDILFVGAGPASLAGAYHLLTLVEKHNESVASGGGKEIGPLEIAILEKGSSMGAHAISGAVMDPRALAELIPDFEEAGFPAESPVTSDEVRVLSAKGGFRLPAVPPTMRNDGNYVVSLGKVVSWLAEKVEEKGAFILPEFPGREPIFDGSRLSGIRTTDRGLDKEGNPKGNHQPGADITARVVVLGEGPRGSLTKQLIARHGLDEGTNPPVFATGVKETWRLPEGRIEPGKVIHTMGYPLDSSTYGGGFIYGGADGMAAIGFATGLDYHHPATDPQAELQRFKEHPFVAALLEGGEVVSFGAKTIPEGGWFAMPRPYFDGGMLIGDCGGFLDPSRLKGIHLGMKSGMLAAETILEGLIADDFSESQLAGYRQRIEASWIREEMWKSRNFHQAMDSGLFGGMARIGIQMLLGGRDIRGDRVSAAPGHTHMKRLSEAGGDRARPTVDNERIFDKLTNVFHSGAIHEEDQPVHLVVSDLDICRTRCAEEYGNPCRFFCPADVYEMVEEDGGGLDLRINASNCVHCKTCDVMDPYQIITWLPPEGGGGPSYKNL